MTTDLPTIGIIVPALAGGGGVPAVGDLICTLLERSGRFRAQVPSLAT